MKKGIFKLLIITAIVIMAADWGYGQYANEEDALRELFISLAGHDWEKTFKGKWAPGEDCKFPGIKSGENNNGTIEKIVISGKERKLLKKILPERGELEELKQFKNLIHLHLSDINYNYPIPGAIWELKKLTRLKLSGNKITGQIPEAVGNLERLEELDLSDNRLSGPIPRGLEKLSNLKKLDLSGNQLSGTIPTWIGSLEKLEELILDDNILGGPIPAALGKLSRLKVLKVGKNKLVGNIPSELKELNLEDDRSTIGRNALYTSDKELKTFLRKKLRKNEKDWEKTQTVVPENLKQEGFAKDSIRIHWDPIPYTQLRGGYRIYCRASGADFDNKPVNTINSKSIDTVTIEGLKENTEYRVNIQTWTDISGRDGKKAYKIESEILKTDAGFPVYTEGVVIGGTVTEGNIPLDNVEIKASSKFSTKTDKKGKYRLNVLSKWSGTVTPVKDGYSFRPSRRNYPPFKNKYDNYIATSKLRAYGRVTYDDIGVKGILISFEGEKKMGDKATTDENGEYNQPFTSKWFGTIVPQKEGLEFSPKAFLVKEEDSTEVYKDRNFKVVLPEEIEGRVKRRGNKGLENVDINFNDGKGNYNITQLGQKKTDAIGKYKQKIPRNWKFKVTPEKKGCVFYPKSISNKKKPFAAAGINFKAEPDFKFFFLITGRYVWPSESRFNDYYGKGFLSPELTAGFKFSRDFYLCGSWGYLAKSGKSDDLGDPTQWKQSNISLGLGYYQNISLVFGWRVSVGGTYVTYSETAMEENVSAWSFGLELDIALIFKITDRFFAEITVGNSLAKDNFEGTEIDLGNLRSGLSLGYRF